MTIGSLIDGKFYSGDDVRRILRAHEALVEALERAKATYEAFDLVNVSEIDAALALARGGK